MARKRRSQDNVEDALHLLDEQYKAFLAAKLFADRTGHPVPSDTKAWSQILVSLLTGISGLKRKKGPDLDDGSDVKGANVWSAIDTPRFNNCIPAGRTSAKAKKPPDLSALDKTPHIFFVMWDEMGASKIPRCRVWCVSPERDEAFRRVCEKWYRQYAAGKSSNNFQLHPPRNEDHNVIRNTCGNLEFPLLFSAFRKGTRFVLSHYDPKVMSSRVCRLADN